MGWKADQGIWAEVEGEEGWKDWRAMARREESEEGRGEGCKRTSAVRALSEVREGWTILEMELEVGACSRVLPGL